MRAYYRNDEVHPEAAVTLTVTVSPDCEITANNLEFERETGWDHQRWIGRRFEAIFAPQDRNRVTNLMASAIESRSPVKTELGLLKKVGAPLPVELVLVPQFRAGDGKLFELWGIASPAKFASPPARLRLSYSADKGKENEFVFILGALAEACPMGFAHWSESFHLMVANRSFYRMFNLSASTNESVSQILPNLSPVLKALFFEVAHKRQSILNREIILRPVPKGARRVFSITCFPSYDEDGEFFGIGTLLQDISAQKNAEEQSVSVNALLGERVRELMQSTRHAGSQARVLGGVLEAVEGGVIVCFEDSSAIVNPTAQRLLRLTSRHPRDVVEFDCLRSVTPNNFWEVLPLKSAMKGETQASTEIFVSEENPGDGYWLNCVVTKLKNEPSEKRGAVITLQDITERKKNEAILKETAEGLARSNRELSQFAYVASHDLKEPLRVVNSYVQLLARRYQGQLDKDADDYIAHASRAAKRMVHLIDDLLAYCRVGKKREFVPINCGDVLEEVVAGLQIAIQETKARVRWAPLPQVWGDALEISQLFQNLISNAIKFSGNKGPDVEISAKAADGKWLFKVKDNGIGIAQEFHERIFLIFQRLHRQEEISGTGLGLAICKKVVDDHGGRLWVESTPGGGSCFLFTLPAA